MADDTEERMALMSELAAHAEVLMRAHRLYEERSESYGQVWRQYGALSNLLNAARKIDRLMEVWWHGWNDGETPVIHKDALDDAFDALNYLTFFIRSVQEGNITGSPPQRPAEGDNVVPLRSDPHWIGGSVRMDRMTPLPPEEATERSKRRHPAGRKKGGFDVT